MSGLTAQQAKEVLHSLRMLRLASRRSRRNAIGSYLAGYYEGAEEAYEEAIWALSGVLER